MKYEKCHNELYDKTAYYGGAQPIDGCMCGTIHFRHYIPVRDVPPDSFSTPEAKERHKAIASQNGKKNGGRNRRVES